MSKMTDAIAAHRAAWQAFQNATNESAHQAEDRESEALVSIFAVKPSHASDVIALIDFLTWYTTEEARREGTSEIEDMPFAYFAALGLISAATNQTARKAKALLDAVDFDNNGAMVAGQLVGGNGGLISRETIRAADDLRKALAEVANG